MRPHDRIWLRGAVSHGTGCRRFLGCAAAIAPAADPVAMKLPSRVPMNGRACALLCRSRCFTSPSRPRSQCNSSWGSDEMGVNGPGQGRGEGEGGGGAGRCAASSRASRVPVVRRAHGRRASPLCGELAHPRCAASSRTPVVRKAHASPLSGRLTHPPCAASSRVSCTPLCGRLTHPRCAAGSRTPVVRRAHGCRASPLCGRLTHCR
jgi:hypothetical protein